MLYAEIKTHRSLSHPNVAHFQHCFEDDNNVHMVPELDHRALMDMLHHPRRFMGPETHFFTLINACHYCSSLAKLYVV